MPFGSLFAALVGGVGVLVLGGVVGGCVRRVGARAVELDGGLREGGLSAELTAVASVLDGGGGEARLAVGAVSAEGTLVIEAGYVTAGAERARHETAPMNPATRATPMRLDTTTSVPLRFEVTGAGRVSRPSTEAEPLRADDPVAMAGSLGTVWANALW